MLINQFRSSFTSDFWASPHACASRGHPDTGVVFEGCFVDQERGLASLDDTKFSGGAHQFFDIVLMSNWW